MGGNSGGGTSTYTAAANGGLTLTGTTFSLGGDSGNITYATGQLTLGAAGSVVGGLLLNNATSGSITLAPTTGALGSSVITFPAVTGVVTVLGNTVTGSGGTLVEATSPTLVTPALGAATGTSLAIGGATLGSNKLAVSGLVNFSSAGSTTTPTFSIGNATTGFYTVSTTGIGMTVNGGATPVFDYGITTGSQFSFTASLNVTGNVSGSVAQFSSVRVGAGGQDYIFGPSTGVMTFYNLAQTGFTRVQFGGTSSSFAALATVNTGLKSQLADASTDATFEASTFISSGISGVSCSANTVTLLTEVVTGGIITHC